MVDETDLQKRLDRLITIAQATLAIVQQGESEFCPICGKRYEFSYEDRDGSFWNVCSEACYQEAVERGDIPAPLTGKV